MRNANFGQQLKPIPYEPEVEVIETNAGWIWEAWDEAVEQFDAPEDKRAKALAEA